jgi:hypothetical protein
MKIKTPVVDDEPDITFTLKTTLEATGFFTLTRSTNLARRYRTLNHIHMILQFLIS